MFCNKCGAKLVEGCSFCVKCGAQVENTASVQAEVPAQQVISAPEVPAQQVISAPEISAQAGYIPQAAVAPEQFNGTAPVVATAPKNKKKVIIPIVAGLLAIIAAIAAIVVIKITSSPIAEIDRAYKKLVNSGKTYSFEIEAKEGGRKTKISATLKMDFKNGYLAFDDIKYKADDGDDMMEHIGIKDINGYIDTKNKELGIFAEIDDEELYVFGRTASDGDENYVIFITEEHYDDVMTVLSNVMALAGGGNIDQKALTESVVDILKPILEAEGIEIDSSSDVIPKEKIDALTKKLTKCFADEKWLEENLEYSKDKDGGETVYSFEISYKTVEAIMDAAEDEILDIVKSAYDYANDVTPDVGEYDEDDFKDFIDGRITALKENKVVFEIEFGVTKNVLSRVTVKVDEATVNVNIERADEELNFKASDFNKYEAECLKNGEEEDLFDNLYGAITRNATNKTCASNIKMIKSCAATFCAAYNRPVQSLTDLASMFDGGKMPVCPVDPTRPYRVEILSNGAAIVECPNCGVGGHNPDGSSPVDYPITY